MNKKNQGQGMVSVGHSPGKMTIDRLEWIIKKEIHNLVIDLKETPERKFDYWDNFDNGKKEGLKEGIKALKSVLISLREWKETNNEKNN